MTVEGQNNTEGIIRHSDKCKNCAFIVHDRVKELFFEALKNHDMKDILQYDGGRNHYFTSFENHHDGLESKHHTHGRWLGNYRSISRDTRDTSTEERTFRYCQEYRMLVETDYSRIVDKVCYMLMWRTDPPTVGRLKKWYKMGDSINKLQDCHLATKIKYLNESGFGYLADACNVDLRNAVAHEDYQIDGSNIHFKKRIWNGTYEDVQVDVLLAYDCLLFEVGKYHGAFSECERGFLKTLEK